MKAIPILIALVLAACGDAPERLAQTSASPGLSQPSPSPAPSPSPWAPSQVSPTSGAPIADSTVDQFLVHCPTLAELAWVDSILTLTFTSDPSQQVCWASQGTTRDLTQLQERAYQAVILFSWIRFDLALPWTDQALDVWLAHAIHGIDFRDDAGNSFCCEAGGVIVVETKNLWVLTASPTKGEIWQATLSLAALFAHEARHNEGYLHTCGPNDQTVAELGSWGLQYYFLLSVGTHSDPSVVPEPYRTAAANSAKQMGRFFCQPPAALAA